ncbi:MAG TPA: PilW family protein [Casimicrobiaceae bacterium]|jgi:type IV pilus assembly protein PilW
MNDPSYMLPMRSPVEKQSGFSLVELMVGLFIGGIVLFAMTVLFANNSRARAQIDQSTQQIENGRYALDVLRDDLHLAGYYGDVAPQQGYLTASGATSDPCATTLGTAATNVQFNLSPLQWPVPVYGVASGDTAPTCVTGPGRKAGTDILVVRRTKTIPTTIATLNANKIYVQASGCNDELKQHKDFVRDVGSNAGTFVLKKKGCGATADVYELQTRLYYVSDETIPTLRVLTISGTTSTNEPLVEGIEDMRVEYGRDIDSDGAADGYRKCLATGALPDPCTAAEWANMMAVRIFLLARNLNPESGYVDTKTYTLGSAAGVTVTPGDNYKRHQYEAVVRLMNPAGTRER